MTRERELLLEALEWMGELKYAWADSRNAGDRVLLELIEDINKVEHLLAQPEQEVFTNTRGFLTDLKRLVVSNNTNELSDWIDAYLDRSSDFIYSQPKQEPEQEPVAWQYRTKPNWQDGFWSGWEDCSKESYEDYKSQPNLHDWVYEARKLYTSPPKCEPLSHDEMLKLIQANMRNGLQSFARAVEKAHSIGL
jgi:hypothetical protein